MKMRILLSAIACLGAIAVSSHAFAQEIEEVEKQNGDALSIALPQKSPWEATVQTTFLPGSAVHGSGGDLSMDEVKADVTRRYAINPRLQLSAGVHYGLRTIDAPESANLPASLQTLSVELGGEYRTSDRLTLRLKIAPGISGDFKEFEARDIRVPVAAHATFAVTRKLTLLGGIAYTGQDHTLRVLPVLGLIYLPSDKWILALGFPRTGVIYKLNKKTDLFLGGEFSGGEYHLHDSSLNAGTITYRDYRIATGAEVQVLPFAKLGISGGYAFARRFAFYDSTRGDIKLDGAPFARAEVKFMW